MGRNGRSIYHLSLSLSLSSFPTRTHVTETAPALAERRGVEDVARAALEKDRAEDMRADFDLKRSGAEERAFLGFFSLEKKWAKENQKIEKSKTSSARRRRKQQSNAFPFFLSRICSSLSSLDLLPGHSNHLARNKRSLSTLSPKIKTHGDLLRPPAARVGAPAAGIIELGGGGSGDNEFD